MSNLKDLASDEFVIGGDRVKLVNREGSIASIAARYYDSRSFCSVSKPPPSRTWSDVNHWIGEYAASRSGITLTRKHSSVSVYQKQLTNAHEAESRFSENLKESKEFDGRSSSESCRRLFFVKETDENCKSGRVFGSKDELYKDEGIKEKSAQSSKNVRAIAPLHRFGGTTLKAVFLSIDKCISDLLENGSFLSSVSQSCISSLNCSEMMDTQVIDNGALFTLKEAIGSVERMITKGITKSEVKKTYFKLSIITGLKSIESSDRHFFGISLSHLVACAHLYLSILCKIQKKDKVSLKHILQVFFHSPGQARTILLPELWEKLFLQEFIHLKAWYGREVESIQGTSGMMQKLEFLTKIYNDLLDIGTSNFAAFYKSLLMENNKMPSLPSILIPFSYFPEMQEEDYEIFSAESMSSSDSDSSKDKISKRPYEPFWTKREVVKAEMEDEIEERKKECLTVMQKDTETVIQSPYPGSYSSESLQSYHSAGSQDLDDFFEDNGQAYETSFGSSGSHLSKSVEIINHAKNSDLVDIENESKLKKTNQSAIESQIIDVADRRLVDKIRATKRSSCLSSLKNKCSVGLAGHCPDIHKYSLISGIPQAFLCPLTGLLLIEPVTLESGYTFELAAIKERYNKGNKTCPITGNSLNRSTIPDTDIAFKQKIDEWVSECLQNSLSFTSNSSKYELSLSIIEQLLCSKERMKNVQRVVSLGGLQILTQILEKGSLELKSNAAGLLLQCVRADGNCKKFISMEAGKPSFIELILSKQAQARINAAVLLIELVCVERRMNITSFVGGLRAEVIESIKRALLLCLEDSQPEDRVLVAVLLLHLDLMEESLNFKVYKGKAIECIVENLDHCMLNKKLIKNCQRALFMLGGQLYFPRIETCLLKHGGFNLYTSTHSEKHGQSITKEESRKREKWLKSMALILLGYKNFMFLKALSNCWDYESSDLVRMCLLTAAWLSHVLASISVPEMRLSTFLSLMPRLNESLNNGDDIKQRLLASLCFFNFSKLLECRAPLITCSYEIYDSLKKLRDVTWTAKLLLKDIFEETK